MDRDKEVFRATPCLVPALILNSLSPQALNFDSVLVFGLNLQSSGLCGCGRKVLRAESSVPKTTGSQGKSEY